MYGFIHLLILYAVFNILCLSSGQSFCLNDTVLLARLMSRVPANRVKKSKRTKGIETVLQSDSQPASERSSKLVCQPVNHCPIQLAMQHIWTVIQPAHQPISE